MTWAAIQLLLSGALDRVLKGLSAAVKWLLADTRHMIIAALAVFGAFHQFILNPRMSDLIDQLQSDLAAEQSAHLGTVNAFLAASARAQAEAEANVARVTAEQEAINREVTRDLRSDLAAVTARFDRLRARDAARADPRHPDPAGLSGPGAAPGRAAGAPGDPDLRTAGELTPQPLCPARLVCLTIDEAQRASEDARRHDALIDWLIVQSAIRFTPEEPSD